LFLNHRAKLVAPASGAGVPAIYPYREVTQADGLLSYGTNIADIVRQAGVMAGKVLKGAKPADLPVQAPTKYELVIQLTHSRRRDALILSAQSL
jgi:putative tryptophan/tyrosine transport system substrate-binding protein